MKERVLFIDMAKGIAIIAIVMLHFSFQFDGESARLIDLFNHSWDTKLFFVLSGMVVSLGGGKIGRRERAIPVCEEEIPYPSTPFRCMEYNYNTICYRSSYDQRLSNYLHR